MKSCDFSGCEEEESLPFKCKLCNQMYCSKHRLPEQHECPMIGIYQTEEYKKSKISQPRTEDEKPKKTPKFRGEKVRSPRDTETRTIYYEPKDRFLSRSSFFNIMGFKNDYLNLAIILIVFSILDTLHIIVNTTLYNNIPISALDWNFWKIILISLGTINFVFGGYFILMKILANRMKEGTNIVIWGWGLLLGLLSIFIPLFAIPGFLTFKEGRSSYTNRGKIAFIGISWILGWCSAIIVIMFGSGFGVPLLYAGVGYAPMFLLLFVLFSLLPFGVYAGSYISRWNRQIYIGTFVCTFILFILYLIVYY